MKTVLVVEDDDSIRDVISQVLCDAEYHAVAVSTLSKAIEALEATIPDAIVLDLMLSDGDGRDLIEACRRDRRLAHLPVIVLTARPFVEEIEGTVLLPKPFDLDELISAVRRVAEASGRRLMDCQTRP